MTMAKRWRNWPGQVRCTPATFAEPRSPEQLCGLVRESAEQGIKVRVVGKGHSWTPGPVTDQTMASLEHLPGGVRRALMFGADPAVLATKMDDV